MNLWHGHCLSALSTPSHHPTYWHTPLTYLLRAFSFPAVGAGLKHERDQKKTSLSPKGERGGMESLGTVPDPNPLLAHPTISA